MVVGVPEVVATAEDVVVGVVAVAVVPEPETVPEAVAVVPGGVTAVDAEVMRVEGEVREDAPVAVVSNERELNGRPLVLRKKSESEESGDGWGRTRGHPRGCGRRLGARPRRDRRGGRSMQRESQVSWPMGVEGGCDLFYIRHSFAAAELWL